MFASVAELFTGSAERHGVACEYGPLLSELLAAGRQDSGLPHLRVHWYDASLSGLPEYDQMSVADLAGVRLRLGRLVRGEQKGVDSRIVRDLIVLASDRAMATAYVLAGDEDITEGVAEAQDHGVRVVLWGVPGVNQSRILTQQADDHVVLPETFWQRFFAASAPGAAAPGPAANGAGAEGPSARHPATRPLPNPAMRAAFGEAARRTGSHDPAAAVLAAAVAEVDAFEKAATEAGAQFARQLRAEATPVDLERLEKLTGWQVPRDLDGQLLRFAEERLGFLWERPELKVIVRNGFWDEFRQAARSEDAGRP